ncbi:hypothetical protein O7628_13570 [Micromonospora sp. WMMD956]|uniref:hypothetical protein n=1 Tax=Micromonospora sp. WMMD956 TaxID=3016108 RepID=UPI0024178800|nr:hypothetical protein [Micromonospora sp. WMMD956]MDG4816526.1 hypothetical protein [Micromonospora sp. WMMD956]
MNGRLHTALVASTTRTDVAANYPAYGGGHGFDLLVPAARGDHTVCVTAINAGAGADTALPCRTVTQGGAPVIDHFLVRAPDYPTPRMEVDVRVGTQDATQVSVWRGPTPNGPWTDWPTPHSTWSNPAGYWEMDLTVDWGRTYCYLATAYNAYGSHTPPAVCATTWAGAYPQPARVGVTGVSNTSMRSSPGAVAGRSTGGSADGSACQQSHRPCRPVSLQASGQRCRTHSPPARRGAARSSASIDRERVRPNGGNPAVLGWAAVRQGVRAGLLTCGVVAGCSGRRSRPITSGAASSRHGR